MQPWRRRFLLLYMMRVPLLFLAMLGSGLPWAFRSSMFHGAADLYRYQLAEAAFLGFLLVSSAVSLCFLILLYGTERADGWAERPAAQDRVSAVAVILLYVYGAICYVYFLFSICEFMSHAGRVTGNLNEKFVLYSATGFVLGLLVTTLFFLGVLRFSKPEDDDALEVFAFPAFFVIRKLIGDAWIRSFKRGTRSQAAAGTFAAHDSPVSRFLADLLGPGYASRPSPEHPSLLHSGVRSSVFLLIFFLAAYWASGQATFWQLKDIHHWGKGFAPNSVLNFVLLVLIFWNSLLTALTFFFDRFRIPALAVLAVALFLIAHLGTSDHFFSTVARQAGAPLPTAAQVFQSPALPNAVVVVAAAGGGIQSAAWSSRVLCGLRADPALGGFQDSVLAISGVSGGSVGAMFYLRCLDEDKADQGKNQLPAKWAQDSSLEAVAWGLTHPDLRQIFLPGPVAFWGNADRGWALERSFLKSAHFAHLEHLADARDHANWPILLLNSTDALTGDPVVFTNSDFPAKRSSGSQENHYLRNFHRSADGNQDVLIETAARMSAAFPYVSPEARPDGVPKGVHLGDGGYFDNSGVFALSEWLKEAVSAGPKRRILFLQLDAFPDSAPSDSENAKKWYYQLTSPITTMLTVRSEGQVIRDKTAGEDLQKILNAAGYQTTWLLIRYLPPPASAEGLPCPADPPLSWHLTLAEQGCIDKAWSSVQPQISPEISSFLKSPPELSEGTCDVKDLTKLGIYERRCAAIPGVAPSLPASTHP